MSSPRKDWEISSELHRNALLRVFSYLEDQDRTQASQVCKSWHQVYQHPSLWRSASFSFKHSERPLPERLQNLQLFVQQRGSNIQKLDIRCPHADQFEPLAFSQLTHTILSGLAGLPGGRSTIKSLKVLDLCLRRKFDRHLSSLSLLVYTVSEFVMFQKNLETIEIRRLSSFDPDTNTVLNCLNKSPSLKVLRTLDLTGSAVSFLNLHEFDHLYKSSQNLKYLRLDYEYICLGRLHEVARVLKNTLEHLAITVDYLVEDQPFVSGDNWTAACVHCPRLKASFRVHMTKVPWEKLLFPSIPLIQLTYKPKSLRDMAAAKVSRRMNSLLKRAAECCYRDLRSMSLSLTSGAALPYKEDIIDCLVRCPNIRELNFSRQLMTYNLKDQVRSDLLRWYHLDRDVINIV